MEFFADNSGYTQDYSLQSRPDYRRLRQKTPCASCFSLESYEVLCNQGPHYSKTSCWGCGRFIRWGKKPANSRQEQEVKTKITWLVEHGQLSSREQDFVEGLKFCKKLSPRQLIWLEDLYEREVGGGAL